MSTHLAMLQRHQSRVVGRADDLVVLLVGGGSDAGGNVVVRQALRVANGVVLPGREVHPVQRTLQHPVPRTRGVGRLDDHVGHLEDL